MDQVMAMAQWLLVLWGVLYLVTTSAIFHPVRVLIAHGSWLRTEWIYCPSCVGFWVSLVLHALGLHMPWMFTQDTAAGFVASGLAALAAGRIWGRFFGESTFEIERPLLELPGDST